MINIQPGTYDYATQEDRSAMRKRITIPGHLRATGGKRLITTVKDISVTGFSAVAITPLKTTTRCWLTLQKLPAIEAEVMWWEAGVVGCSFVRLLSSANLQGLIEQWYGPTSLGSTESFT